MDFDDSFIVILLIAFEYSLDLNCFLVIADGWDELKFLYIVLRYLNCFVCSLGRKRIKDFLDLNFYDIILSMDCLRDQNMEIRPLVFNVSKLREFDSLDLLCNRIIVKIPHEYSLGLVLV